MRALSPKTGDNIMVVGKTRHQAIELTRNFVSTVSLATGKPMDFYKLLWVIHWAIENFGLEKTQHTLADILVDSDFDPEHTPIVLRDRLFVNRVEQDALEDWFKRAISV